MPRLFGTDGVRGRANQDISVTLASGLAMAAVRVLVPCSGEDRPRALVGRDPRASGELLECAVAAGLASCGVDVVRLGIVPTPGLAHLAEKFAADLAIMVTASHNPMPDNGLKVLGPGGRKLSRDEEAAIERCLDGDGRLVHPQNLPIGPRVGRVKDNSAAQDEYVHHLAHSFPAWMGPRASLAGLSVVLDTAHGAAHRVAPAVLRLAGAEVTPINNRPDGLNINDRCGTNHPEALQRAVLEGGADLGLALDADGDRCVAVDANGEIVDGDRILAILALAAQEAGMLAADTVVTTVMGNRALVRALEGAGITVRVTDIGERAVLEAMDATGATLGGEQAGNILLGEFTRHGDAVLTGLHLMARMAETGAPLAALAQVYEPLPQVLLNVPIDPGVSEEQAARISATAAQAYDANGDGADGDGAHSDGVRVVVRPSGTEPVVRIMVEAASCDTAQEIARQLAERIETLQYEVAQPVD